LNDDGGAFVSWIEEGANSAAAMVRLVSPTGVAGPALKVLAGPRTSLGYPKLVRAKGETWIAWGDAKTGVKTAQLK
jgi:hypothetical protein